MNTTRNLLKIGLVANIFEWYEFGIYAYLANIIGQNFFDISDSIGSFIQGFSVFAIGYFSRFFGSLFFGIMGDRVGRGRPLKITLIMMAVPTGLIGLLPTYHDVGLLAPVLLIALRLIQGFAMGGELPVNGCYIFEASPTNRRSLLCSVVMVSISLGMLLASLTAFLLAWIFDRETILSWAWRIPFLLSIPLTIGISIMRRIIHDLPVPPQIKKGRPATIIDMLKWPLLKASLLSSCSTVFGFTLAIWMPFYLTHFLAYPFRLAQLSNILTLIALVGFKLAAGTIANLAGYQRLVKAAVVTTILLIYPLFSRFQRVSFGTALVVQLLLACLLGSMTGVIMEALARQFPPFVRCRGMNLAYTLTTVFLGSTTPLVLTWVINKTGWLMFPAFYIMFFGLLALPAAWRLKGVED